MSAEGRRRPTLSLTEWVVLGLLAERPRHGYDVATELRPGTPLGDVWTLSRQVVYRALARLEALELADAARREPGAAAPPRTVYEPTEAGSAALATWLVVPVRHLREVRSELLVKLLLGRRLEVDPAPLVAAQREALAPVLDRLAAPPAEPGHVTALWRHHSAGAIARFLADLEG